MRPAISDHITPHLFLYLNRDSSLDPDRDANSRFAADDKDMSRSFYSKTIRERLDVFNSEMEDLSQFNPYLIAQLVRKVAREFKHCKIVRYRLATWVFLGNGIWIAKSLRAAKNKGKFLAETFQQYLELWQGR
jgi:hypothetical protein